MTVLLDIEALTIRIGGQPVVRDVDLSLAAGESLGIVGESGSGKSMTALAIMGLLPVAARLDAPSRISLQGRRIEALPERERRAIRGRKVGMVFQDPMACLNPFMPVGRQIQESIETHTPLRGADARKKVRALLEEVGLGDAGRRIGAYPHELSGGQQQRVMIAIALAADPALLIADEPTTALDATVQRQILALLRQIRLRRGMGLVFISHDLGVVASVSDAVAVMRDGRVVEKGPTRRVLSGSGHPYTRLLVESRRRLGTVPVSRRPGGPAPLSIEALRIEYSRPFSFRRGEMAVDGVDLEIPAGRTLGLIGESGSGKSSIARAIAGLVRPRSGRMSLLGHELRAPRWQRPKALRGRCQIVFQNPYGALNPRLKVAPILAEVLDAVGAPKAGRGRQLRQSLIDVGLSEAHLERYPHELSGGQRQRVCIARALLSRPEVLLCDEVVSSLDVSTQVQILELLAKLQEEHGFAMLFIGHDLDGVAAVSHELAVLKDGRVVERGETRSVLTQPASGYTRALVAAMEEVRIVPREEGTVPRPGEVGSSKELQHVAGA